MRGGLGVEGQPHDGIVVKKNLFAEKTPDTSLNNNVSQKALKVKGRLCDCPTLQISIHL